MDYTLKKIKDSEDELTESQQISLDRFIFDVMDSFAPDIEERQTYPELDKPNYKIETEVNQGNFKTSGKIIDVKPFEKVSSKKEAVIKVYKKEKEINKEEVSRPKSVQQFLEKNSNDEIYFRRK